jgi:ferredoxin-type protein NapH
MSYAKGEYQRSLTEKIFVYSFIPLVLVFYTFYKWPDTMVEWGLLSNVRDLYFLNKHPGFWYSLIYSGIVCYIAGKILWKNQDPYKKGKGHKLSSYQKKKFTSIFLVQGILLFLLPYVLAPLMSGQSLLFDATSPIHRDYYVYVSRGFTSIPSFIWVFVAIPISVYFFGKKFCSWFCACGNLAETIGVTKWGAAWVKYKTPTGKVAKRLEHLQTVFLIIGLGYGIFIALDLLKIATATSLLEFLKAYQDFAIDFIFGAVIGIGAYPFFGTRIWCRYGCPLAKGMELFGKHVKTQFAVVANDRCKGINLCSQVCPMGIDVAGFAHVNKQPTNGQFSLEQTPCIGCGGCIDACPVDALSFRPIQWNFWENAKP